MSAGYGIRIEQKDPAWCGDRQVRRWLTTPVMTFEQSLELPVSEVLVLDQDRIEGQGYARNVSANDEARRLVSEFMLTQTGLSGVSFTVSAYDGKWCLLEVPVFLGSDQEELENDSVWPALMSLPFVVYTGKLGAFKNTILYKHGFVLRSDDTFMVKDANYYGRSLEVYPCSYSEKAAMRRGSAPRTPGVRKSYYKPAPPRRKVLKGEWQRFRYAMWRTLPGSFTEYAHETLDRILPHVSEALDNVTRYYGKNAHRVMSEFLDILLVVRNAPEFCTKDLPRDIAYWLIEELRSPQVKKYLEMYKHPEKKDEFRKIKESVFYNDTDVAGDARRKKVAREEKARQRAERRLAEQSARADQTAGSAAGEENNVRGPALDEDVSRQDAGGADRCVDHEDLGRDELDRDAAGAAVCVAGTVCGSDEPDAVQVV